MVGGGVAKFENAGEGGRTGGTGQRDGLPCTSQPQDARRSYAEGDMWRQGGEELNSIINEAMARFVVSNPLHPDVFPGLRKMESEIVSMCLNL